MVALFTTPDPITPGNRAVPFAIIYIPDATRFTGGKDAAGVAEEMEVGGHWEHEVHPIIAAAS